MKEILIILSSTWKFAATFPIAVFAFKMSFFEILLYTNMGGYAGTIVFTMASKGIIKIYEIYLSGIFRKRKKVRRRFTKRNRRIIIIKNKYGLSGIIILTHILLSIPLGVFLITKYFGKNVYNYLYLSLAQLAWSFIFTVFYMKVYLFLPL